MSDQSIVAEVVYKIHSVFTNYRFGDDGSVWSKETQNGTGRLLADWRWRRLNPSLSSEGYRVVCLYAKGKCKLVFVHQVILMLFVGERPRGMMACHNDGSRENNQLPNLRWDTPKNNTADRKKHGTYCFGEDNPNCKVTNEQRAKIAEMKSSGSGCTEIGRRLGLPRTTVWGVLSRRQAALAAMEAKP